MAWQLARLLLPAVLLMTGCAAGGSQPGKGIAYQPVSFEVVRKGSEPAAVTPLLQRAAEPGAETVTLEGWTYAAIRAGERRTGGYSIEVLSVGDSEGKITVVYRVNAPPPDSFVTQALTYPTLVIRFKNPANLPVVFRQEQ